MKVAVVGARDYPKPEQVREFVRTLDPSKDELVSGGGGVVDLTAEDEAKKLGIPCRIFLARWEEFGSAAGPMRNTLVAEYCDVMTAFFYGDSPGTSDVVAKARALGKTINYCVHSTT